MRFTAVFLAAMFAAWPGTVRADDAAKGPAVAWSPTVQGLRARLYTLPSTEPEYDKTYDVWIEIQEVGLDTSLGLEHKAVTLRYVTDNQQFQVDVTDGKGGAVPQSNPGAPVDEQVGAQDLIIPPKGDLTFPIAYGGSSPHHPPPGALTPRGRLLVFDVTREWLISFDGGPYHLAASLVVSKSDGQLPNASPYRGWTGTLVLPPIELPGK
jgi:hypothetical protein